MQHAAVKGLPEADAVSAAHCRRVRDFILEQIAAAGGSISFAEYMQHALYAPGLGYYVSGAQKFGEGGDFVTAPEISPLFGRVLARQVAEVLRDLGGGSILELGAGSGALAVAVLEKLAELDALPDQYRILEVSPELAERQQQLLRQQLPQHAARMEWLSALPSDLSGVIIVNEVADALPVERFSKCDGLLQQCRVTVDKGEFAWTLGDAPQALLDAVGAIEEQTGRRFADGYRSEICLALSSWIGDLVSCLRRGLILLFDYGVSRREYYAPDRTDGWIRCHFRHHAHDDPLILQGVQDLTAWVDFSALAGAAAGARVAGFVSQAHFLLNGGLEEELADFMSLPVGKQLELSRQVKLLTLPGEMGENVKCIALSRGNVDASSAFRQFDRTHTL